MARRTGNKRSRSFFGLSPNAGLRLVGGAALIAASVLAIYWPSLRGDFLLDDELLVSRTTLIRAPDALYRFWFTTQATDYWPVTNSTFWLEFRAWETNATGYHITNLVLHILDCVLIWGILRRLAIPGAFLAALLFAVHPVNVESVAWISQRKNVLSLLFFLLSILFYLRWRAPRIADEASLAQPAAALSIRTPAPTPSSTRSSSVDWKWYLLSLASFVLAGLSKGSVVILPLVLLLILWWQNGGLTVRDLAQAAPFFAVAIVLTLVDVWFQTHGSREVIREATFVQRLLGAGAVVWFYLWKAFVPLHLAFFYPQWDIDPGQVRWWLPLVAWVTVTALLIWRRHSRFGRPLLFAWAFFCLGLLPVMGFTDVGFMKHSLVADHYQHIALVGVVALVAAASSYGFDRWIGQPTHMAVKVIAATIPLFALGYLSFLQSDLFAHPVRLYEATLRSNPSSWLAEVNLANTLADAGQAEGAIDHYRRSLALHYDNPAGHVNLGLALEAIGQVDAATDEYREALKIQHDYLPAINDLGNALAAAGKTDDAIAQYQEALRIQPDHSAAHFNWGRALVKQGRSREAIQHFQAAVTADPYYFDAQLALANALADSGSTAEAIDSYERAVHLAPNDQECRYNFAATLVAAHRLPEAIAQYEDVLRIAPGHFEAESSLGAALAMSGQLPEALAHFERAVKLKPDYGQAYFNLAMAQASLGQRDQARVTAQKALDLARSQSQTELANQIQSWLQRVPAGQR